MGRYVNGKATLSENIADLGGLAIALDALKRKMYGLTKEQQQKEIRDFFIAYAVTWRTKERREQAIYRLFTDVHAPAELRVNLIVNQFADFYELFDVKPGDELYIDPKDRIHIF
jgi:putative endopeptidase